LNVFSQSACLPHTPTSLYIHCTYLADESI
jgi:hypothetical protein